MNWGLGLATQVWWSISIAHWPALRASMAVNIVAAHGWRARRSRGYQSRFTVRMLARLNGFLPIHSTAGKAGAEPDHQASRRAGSSVAMAEACAIGWR